MGSIDDTRMKKGAGRRVAAVLGVVFAFWGCSKRSDADSKKPPKPRQTQTQCDRAALSADALKRGRKVLAGVKLTRSTAQKKLLSQPGDFAGKTVRIEGPVVGICRKAGCWAALEGPDGKTVNLKVTDGVVDFRNLAKKGVYAVGEGVFNARGHHGPQVIITGAVIGNKICR